MECGRKYHPTSVPERRRSNGNVYPAAWAANDAQRAKYFFASADDRCDAFYGGGSCDMENTCPSSDAGSSNDGVLFGRGEEGVLAGTIDATTTSRPGRVQEEAGPDTPAPAASPGPDWRLTRTAMIKSGTSAACRE